LVWSDYLGTTHPVPVLNDAQAALLGEVWLGAARGLDNVILLTLGTGVGGAAMVDGHLLRGHIGRAGHLGHICLDLDGAKDITNLPGSLEDLIGNWTVQQRSRGRFATTHELVAAYKSGDAFATKVWLRSIRALGCAIGSFVNVLDPEAVVIGGGIARSGRSLLGPLQRVLDEVEWRPGGARVKLLTAKLGEFAGAYGAARNAFHPERDGTL
jgi:glucokinase